MKDLLESRSKSRYTSSMAYRNKAEVVRRGNRDRYGLAEPKKVEVTCLMKHFQDTFCADKKITSKLMKALKKVQIDLQPKCRPATKIILYAACKLASSHLLRFALQIRRKAVGSLLGIKKNIMELQLYNESDLGQRQHAESRDTFFADAAYIKADVPSPIAVQANGQCRLSDVKYSKYPQQKSCSTGNETKEVLYWECSSRCKPVSVQDIVDTKLLFEGNIPDMRKSLDELDQCPHTHTYKQEWHYPISRVQVCNTTDNTKPVAEGGSANESHCTDEDLPDEDSDDEGSDGEGDDCPVLRAGHPIVCHLEGSPCQSKLRILRAAAVHYPKGSSVPEVSV